MEKELALQVLGALLVSAPYKIKKKLLKEFFVGLDIIDLIKTANERYRGLGFFIHDDGESIEIVNRPELSRYLINFFGFEENYLIQEMLEVLAIIAYGGPLNVREIDKIRGKKSLYVLKELFKEGYVEKRKNYYKVSEKFLKFLGFKKEEELPDYKKLREEIRKLM